MDNRATYFFLSIVAVIISISLYSLIGESLPLKEFIGENIGIHKKGKVDLDYTRDNNHELSTREKIVRGIKININKAGRMDIASLPGISVKTADNLVNMRNKTGIFKDFKDLLRVKGIKAKRLEMIKPFIEL